MALAYWKWKRLVLFLNEKLGKFVSLWYGGASQAVKGRFDCKTDYDLTSEEHLLGFLLMANRSAFLKAVSNS